MRAIVVVVPGDNCEGAAARISDPWTGHARIGDWDMSFEGPKPAQVAETVERYYAEVESCTA